VPKFLRVFQSAKKLNRQIAKETADQLGIKACKNKGKNEIKKKS